MFFANNKYYSDMRYKQLRKIIEVVGGKLNVQL